MNLVGCELLILALISLGGQATFERSIRDWHSDGMFV